MKKLNKAEVGIFMDDVDFQLSGILDDVCYNHNFSGAFDEKFLNRIYNVFNKRIKRVKKDCKHILLAEGKVPARKDLAQEMRSMKKDLKEIDREFKRFQDRISKRV